MTHAALTLSQAASLTSGGGAWTTKSVAGIPAMTVTDGPHGVRLQSSEGDEHDLANSIPATCFPTAAALGCSFDPQLMERVGAALGAEASAAGVSVLLGPGINIKRSPLGGRNFEYLSEDPLLSGVLGAALVRGIQSQGVAACVKHFAVNNQETDRLRVSADVDERPLREIYLRAFERVVRTAAPATIMSAYNRINGTPASENSWLLTEVLRNEWGFEGVVISDWGAVDDRVAALKAGLDLEMPSTQGRSDRELLAAAASGALDEQLIRQSAERIAHLASTYQPRRTNADFHAHHRLAREAAAASIVLLKNDGALPLAAEPSKGSVAVIGELARTPRYQGAGSSLVNPTHLTTLLSSLANRQGEDPPFSAGYRLDGEADASLIDHALRTAQEADTVILALGLPTGSESEGFDRVNIELPRNQVALFEALTEASTQIVVVLSHGGALRLTDITVGANAIVDGWLLGQAGGEAMTDVLLGVANPSGRLAETLPLRIEDTAAFGNFPGELGHVRYGEGIFVGYRWYDNRDIEVAYPFGHGLSYTKFEYSNYEAEVDIAGNITLSLDVTNTGNRDGADVVQVYLSKPDSRYMRPPFELKGFAKVTVASGQTVRAAVRIDAHDVAIWDIRNGRWMRETGQYELRVGTSSRDTRYTARVNVQGRADRGSVSLDSTITEVLSDPEARAAILALLRQNNDTIALQVFDAPEPMIGSFPVGRIASFQGVVTTKEEFSDLLERLSAQR